MITYELHFWDLSGQSDIWATTTTITKLKRLIKKALEADVKLKDVMVFEGDPDDTHANYRKTLNLELNDKGY